MIRLVQKSLWCAWLLASSALCVAAESAEWNFRVKLDNKVIGYHNFALQDLGDERRLLTEAEFRVRVLFFTAFQYAHTNQETWQGNCLREINSTTDENGKAFSVAGEVVDDLFTVSVGADQSAFDGCVKSFAYWNPDILKESALLNSQTGELLPVEIERIQDETVMARGSEVLAQRFRLIARDMRLDVWYTPAGEWIGLESTVKGGRKLRYELI